ncbi:MULTISPECIES: superoxide dismutase family protein [unclassified Leptolyngbya]|uniref:superoxide dismutase family protein n=1 Tax=unclassified Leptolyngbya TaxID=2650499 RepID=UPI001684D9C1|nr:MULTISPECIES: superoxide dismutase family protein [unclassified Leptolyngbya]MBD1911184.1 superoxide dismutase family protein [Leptolyngbya sp. FACHB-8]MBD2155431.1 superoxide dismutase family protein [Leptolyngbya sp. FACHB-16]
MLAARRLTRLLSVLALLGLVVFLYLGVQGEAWAESLSTATLESTSSDNSLRGEITFTPTESGVLVEAQVTGAPAGPHGFHIHENASCADAGNAAGGHFNPDGSPHGNLQRDGFANAHAGDLGNLTIAADGSGSYREEIPGLTLTDGKYAIANHAVILHEKVDSYVQPTGDAGGRIACGIVQVAE